MANFGRVVEILIGNQLYSSNDFTIEGSVPFDNDPLPNESEIKIYNLSRETLGRFKRDEQIAINAGYMGDIGVILNGYISHTSTVFSGPDKITTIHALDGPDPKGRTVKEITYAKGTLASYILREMAQQLGLPIAQFYLNQDMRYDDGYTAKGEVTKIISDIAADCGTSAFMNKGKLYIRNLRIGADDVFKLGTETGLIGSPEYWEDEQFSGYKVKSQLQYRITTASVIDLDSRIFQGRVHVRSGVHHFSNSGDFITEAEAILP